MTRLFCGNARIWKWNLMLGPVRGQVLGLYSYEPLADLNHPCLSRICWGDNTSPNDAFAFNVFFRWHEKVNMVSSLPKLLAAQLKVQPWLQTQVKRIKWSKVAVIWGEWLLFQEVLDSFFSVMQKVLVFSSDWRCSRLPLHCFTILALRSTTHSWRRCGYPSGSWRRICLLLAAVATCTRLSWRSLGRPARSWRGRLQTTSTGYRRSNWNGAARKIFVWIPDSEIWHCDISPLRPKNKENQKQRTQCPS